MILPLRDVLGAALRAAGLAASEDLWRILDLWPEVAGDAIAARSRPCRLRRGELALAIPDAVWRQEISLMAPELTRKLNEKLGRRVVERIRVVTAGIPPEPQPRERRRRLHGWELGPGAIPPPPENASPELAAALAALGRSRARRLARDRGSPRE